MQRWAITKQIKASEDLKPPRVEVLSIHSREDSAGPPPMPGLNNSDLADRYAVLKVADGVVVGMVKGGKVDAADGFGWLTEADRLVKPIDSKPRYGRRRDGMPRT